MLFAEKSPNDGDVLDANVYRDRTQRTDDAEREAQQAEAVEREGLDDAEHVHVDVDSTDEGAEEVHEGRAGDGADGGEHDVGGGERHGDPRVAGHSQQQLAPQCQLLRVDNQQNTLKPPVTNSTRYSSVVVSNPELVFAVDLHLNSTNFSVLTGCTS